MNEVSCRVLIGLVQMAEASGISRDKLHHGFRQSPAHLMDPRNRADWESGMEMLRRLRREAGSEEAFLAVAQTYGQTPAHRYIRSLATSVFDPMHFFTLPSRIFLRMTMGDCVGWEWKKLGGRRIEVVHTSDLEHPAPHEYWSFNQVAYAKLPNMLGLPDAEVTFLDWSPHHGRYLIVVPPSGTLWHRMWFFLRLGRGRETAESPEREREGGTDGVLSSLPLTAADSPVSQAPPSSDNEVSCRVVLGFVKAAETAGIGRDKMLQGFRHAPERLTDPAQRTDWAICLGVLENLRSEAGSREEFLRVIRDYAQPHSSALIKSFSTGIFSPVHFYTYPQRIALQQGFGNCMTWQWRQTDARTVEGLLTCDQGHPATPEFWEVCGAGMSKLPRSVNLPDAVVEITAHGRFHAKFRIIVPPSGTLWARAARFLRLHGSSPDPLFEIFASAHEDLRQSYDVLGASERERAELARDLLRVADAEREQFARDIHDGLGQELFALKLQCDSLAGERGEFKAQLERLGELAGKAQQMARALARGYDPILGAGGDFADAVRLLAGRYEGTPAFDLDRLCEVPVDSQKATQLYRIVQEAVNNALRHGAAKRVRIFLDAGRPLWTLTVADDGSGFDPGVGTPGMGLRAMRYRASQLGGNLAVERCPGGGMQVVCTFLPDSNP